MKISAAGEDEKFVVFGALDSATGQVFEQISPRKDEDAFAAFLAALLAALPPDEPVVLVLDNVGYHKSHALRLQWQRLADHVEPFWLPAYAPQLNLMERASGASSSSSSAVIGGGTISTACNRPPRPSSPTWKSTFTPRTDRPFTWSTTFANRLSPERLHIR